jgi:hypothetical protein
MAYGETTCVAPARRSLGSVLGVVHRATVGVTKHGGVAFDDYDADAMIRQVFRDVPADPAVAAYSVVIA